jgi:hypothetical protein
MPLSDLSEEERCVVHDCLRASLEGPFFPEWEFTSLFGISRSDLAQVVAAWPQVDEQAETVRLAINNSMNNLLGYPHGCERAWPEFLAVSRQEVERIYVKWCGRHARGLR